MHFAARLPAALALMLLAAAAEADKSQRPAGSASVGVDKSAGVGYIY